MSWVSVGVTAVTTIGGAIASRKKAPQAAVPKPVDVQEEQARAIAGNAANFNAAASLSAKSNAFDQSQALALLEQAMPGYGAMRKKLMAQADSDLANQTTLPPEMQQQLQRFAAEKGITRGTSGNFNAFSLVKDFGFNLVDWQNASRARALNTLSSVFQMTPRINVMSPMSMMVNPNTAIQVAGNNNAQQYQAQQSAYDAQAAARNQNAALMGSAITSAGSVIAGGIRQYNASKPSVDRDEAGNRIQSYAPTPAVARITGSNAMSPYVVKGTRP
ncbi:MAG TPA: hypothetical protein VGE76_02295 [Opitutaceae bacterium]